MARRKLRDVHRRGFIEAGCVEGKKLQLEAGVVLRELV
jgi:hypothetical protein